MEVPIGPFFGSGLGQADIRSLFVGMSISGTYYCYLPMPFKNGIRITIQNRSYESGGEFFCEIGHTNQFPAEQQGAAIARSLATDPPIILADEPTGNLDSKSAEMILSLFESLAAQGKTILIVTHDPS